MKRLAALALVLATVACVTPAPLRMYSNEELGRAGAACGLALGELVQEEEEPRILFMIVPAPGQESRACVLRWARRRSLHLVTIEGLERVPDAPAE